MNAPSLTAQQREALWSDGLPYFGKRAIAARPGTGKTATISMYCGDILKGWIDTFHSWQGLALLSYTNVAKDELSSRLAKSGFTAPSGLQNPHYAGTVDAFVNQFLFLPFGAQVMRCRSRPRLVGEPYSKFNAGWPLKNRVKAAAGNPYSAAFFDCYSLSVDGPIRIVPAQTKRDAGGQKTITPGEVTKTNCQRIRAMKEFIWREEGIAVQSDANYLALRVLREIRGVASALARRFPVLIIDESQDTTAVQHAILDELACAGLANIVVVGDQHQAIYEWNTADPALFIAKYRDPDWNPKTLDQTFRCSPAISKLLTALCPDEDGVVPCEEGKNAHYTAPVRAVSRSTPDEISSAVVAEIERMRVVLDQCVPHDDRSQSRSLLVLARSTDHCTELEGRYRGKTVLQSAVKGSIEWRHKHTSQFLQLLKSLRGNDLLSAVRRYEQIIMDEENYDSLGLMRRELELKWVSSDKPPGISNYRAALARDIQAMRQQFRGAREPTIGAIASAVIELGCIPELALREIQEDCGRFAGGKDVSLTAVVGGRHEVASASIAQEGTGPSSVRVTFSTVHGVKGETHDGVILAINKQTGACGCESISSNQWSKILLHPLEQCETKRIAYVAVSRAARLLTVVGHSSAIETLRTLPISLHLD